MSDTMKAALDAANAYWRDNLDTRSVDAVIHTAKRFHEELVTAAPGAAEDWDEEWYSRVNAWVRALSGDQRGSVESALRNSAPAPLGYAYAPVPYGPPQVPEAWQLLDKLNGPQPYPGTAAPIGPLVTRDELDRELAKLGGDPRNEGDVAAAATSWRNRTLAPEPAAISEALGRQDGETILAAAERVMSKLAVFRHRAEQAEARLEQVYSDAEHQRLAPGESLRIREKDADPFTSTTVTAELVLSPTEGFMAYVPPGAFSEAKRDELGSESIDRLLKLLAPAKLSGTVTQQIKELVGTMESLRGQLQARDVGIREHEKQLREVLGAWGESDDWDNPHAEETSLDAAQRVVKELEASEQRVQYLTWQLSEEQIEHQGRVRYFNTENEPPSTVDVLKLVVKPSEREACGGYLMRADTGWFRVQQRPEQMPSLPGPPWAAAFIGKGVRARELTTAENKNWERD